MDDDASKLARFNIAGKFGPWIWCGVCKRELKKDEIGVFEYDLAHYPNPMLVYACHKNCHPIRVA